jgi:histone acetyltransferase (RNA polymerase elongator complex component)
VQRARAEHFKAMKTCGVREVTIGVEALSDAVLAGMKTGNSYDDILRAFSFIFGEGGANAASRAQLAEGE